MVVPKPLAGRGAPFTLAFYGHGYTGSLLDALGLGPVFAAPGIAAVGINAMSHGFVMDARTRVLVSTVLRDICNVC